MSLWTGVRISAGLVTSWIPSKFLRCATIRVQSTDRLSVAERGDNVTTGSDGRAIEPHTGLPIDLSKGTGEGGTDGGVVPGFHSHHTGAGSGTGSGY